MPDQNRPISWDLFYLTKEGMEAHLQLRGTTVEDTLSDSVKAVSAVRSAGGVARPLNGSKPMTEESSTDGPPLCGKCGSEMTFREGTSKNGKDYKGYFCPDRDCSGEPVWVNG